MAGDRPNSKSLKDLLEYWYNAIMTIKEIALKAINELPENATWEDIQERVNFALAVRKGLGELDEGKGMPHEKVKEEFSDWFTS